MCAAIREHGRCRVRGYWRCSVRGAWHWVSDHDRGFLSGIAVRRSPFSHSGRVGQGGARSIARGSSAGRTAPAKPKYPPWCEVRYLLRYFGEDGKKYSHYIPRVVGERWRERSRG